MNQQTSHEFAGDRSFAIEQCRAHVARAFAGNDCSHDLSHVYRVCSLALKIARTVPGGTNEFVVEMAALLHDLYDYKYSSVTADDGHERMKVLLLGWNVSDDVSERIVNVAQNIGYSKEMKRRARLNSVAESCDKAVVVNSSVAAADDDGGSQKWESSEFACVQDADYLDAMGAIGMLRTAAFSGARGRPLISGELMEDSAESCIDHVHAKVLHLKSLMRTDEGKRLAEHRHQFMLTFLQQLQQESKESIGINSC